MSIHYYLARLWFVANVALALAPPLHWMVEAHETPVLGLPASLFYFLGLGLSIMCSLIYAYWQECANGEFK